MTLLVTATVIVLAVSSLIIGFFCVKKPRGAIEFQIRFYALINWRIEPICLEKEIRNTRVMGTFLILCAFAALFFALPW